ncbi:hypothetical protein [Geodermatophilus sp. SYSU D01036]
MRRVTGRAAGRVDRLPEDPAVLTQEIDQYRDRAARGPDREPGGAGRVPCPGDERPTLTWAPAASTPPGVGAACVRGAAPRAPPTIGT